MTDQKYRYNGPISVRTGEPDLFGTTTFTRSNGSTISRLYERLTKASRRREDSTFSAVDLVVEDTYRKGVYDAFKALKQELL
jgi:hypothetical protein